MASPFPIFGESKGALNMLICNFVACNMISLVHIIWVYHLFYAFILKRKYMYVIADENGWFNLYFRQINDFFNSNNWTFVLDFYFFFYLLFKYVIVQDNLNINSMSGLGGPEIIKFTILLWKKLYIGHCLQIHTYSSNVYGCVHRVDLYT